MPGYISRSMCGCSVHGEILHSFACLLKRYRKASGRIPEGGALFEAQGDEQECLNLVRCKDGKPGGSDMPGWRFAPWLCRYKLCRCS